MGRAAALIGATAAVAAELSACSYAPRSHGVRIIRDAPYEEREPAPSPDGRRLAFLADSDGDGANELWISEIGGENPRRITIREELNSAVAWRPDGKLLVGAIRKEPGHGELIEIDPEGGVARPIEAAGVDPMTPALSPDGRLLAYAARASASGKLAIWLAESNGGGAAVIAPSAEQSLWPRFTPDSESIAFFSRRDTAGEDDELHLVEIRSGVVRRLTSQAGHDFTPAPSPDGRFLAFITNRDGRPALHVFDLRNGDECRFATDDRAVTHPAWTPDGAHLFATVRRDNQPADIAAFRFSPRLFRKACVEQQETGR